MEALTDGQRGTIIVDETPFYGTMGGQCGDTGVITGANNGTFVVEDTIHLQGGKIGHVGHMTSGMLAAGETVTLKGRCRHPAVPPRRTTAQPICFRRHCAASSVTM